MKPFLFFCIALFGLASPAAQQQPASGFVYETPSEFFSNGDFDGDGRVDLVIVDKGTGKFRVGYGSPTGTVSWVDCRVSGLKEIRGFNIGKFISPKYDALAFADPAANAFSLADASDQNTPGKPVNIPFSGGVGANTIAGIGGAPGGRPGLLDLYISSTLNSPDPNLATLLRNDGSEFVKISEVTLPGVAALANRVALKVGQADLLAVLVRGEAKDTLRIEDWSSGKPVSVVTVSDLAAGSEYAVGNFRGNGLKDFVFYKPGESKIIVRPMEDAGGGKFQAGNPATHDLAQPITRIVTLEDEGRDRLFVVSQAEKGGVFAFDGVKAPSLIQPIITTNEVLTCVAGIPGGLIAFSRTAAGTFSTKYYAYKNTGSGYAFSVFGTLPTLADNDNMIIPDIRDQIVAKQTIKSEADMKPYTNVIPGTQITFAMVPIPGGEFVMGSPNNENGRKPDEGPQHKVKISPFWMQQCEVTWGEYELFMYPEEERRTRATEKTDQSADDLADAVTHPSRPYTEMSFGMGKDGFPAIAMTHHAANKYCQWLSAKTGVFYRLPTEAEWEYACRAGTKTLYFFGEDAKELGKYAWYDENSDFKYQKVMKKKPNPWGLYDIYGNVTEWVLDQYDPDYYKQVAQGVTDPWNRATKPYPHSVRGGSWEDEAPVCRSAARRGSERTWKMTDPQLPKSVWYLSDATFVGFRIIRPLKVPTTVEMQRSWSSGTERD
jgi:formylglycine-generating enzyme required for sulfatase activity